MTVKELFRAVECNNPVIRGCPYWESLRGRFIKPLPIVVDNIAKKVIDTIVTFNEVSVEEVCSNSRKREYAYIRSCIWYLLYKYYRKRINLTQMAKSLNRKSHGTVISSIDNISAWLKTSKQVQDDIGIYEQLLINKGVIIKILPYYERKPNKYKWVQDPEYWN